MWEEAVNMVILLSKYSDQIFIVDTINGVFFSSSLLGGLYLQDSRLIHIRDGS